MQSKPILTPSGTKGIKPIQTRPHFVVRTSCRGEAARMPPHEMLNSECIPETFFVACRIAPSASARRQKTSISSVRAINEQVIRHISPTSGKRALEKWRLTKSVLPLYTLIRFYFRSTGTCSLKCEATLGFTKGKTA